MNILLLCSSFYYVLMTICKVRNISCYFLSFIAYWFYEKNCNSRYINIVLKAEMFHGTSDKWIKLIHIIFHMSCCKLISIFHLLLTWACHAVTSDQYPSWHVSWRLHCTSHLTVSYVTWLMTRLPAQAWMSHLPFPELQQLALNFLVTFFGRHPPEQQPSNRFHRLLLLQFSSAWALYVALSSLIPPLRQPVRPFTNNKAL